MEYEVRNTRILRFEEIGDGKSKQQVIVTIGIVGETHDFIKTDEISVETLMSDSGDQINQKVAQAAANYVATKYAVSE